MKYLIAGLGNIGPEYAFTRHNVGFMALDRLAAQQGFSFKMERLAYIGEFKHKGKQIYCIKPTTYRWSPDYNISDINIRSPVVWPRRGTTYSATLRDSAGCVSGFTDVWIISIISDTKEVNNLLKVSVYPNPLVAASQLSIDSEYNADKILNIYNSAGQMVYGQKITASKIPIGQFIKENGTYFYQITSNHKQLAVGKFVKN